MRFFKFIFLSICLFIFSSCEELHWTDEDILNETKHQSLNQPKQDSFILSEFEKNNKSEIDHDFIQEKLTVISGSLELEKHTIIKSLKVILDKAVIQTNEYNLSILADEFSSNHSTIQNFKASQTAQAEENGKNGGRVLISSNKASGVLSLFLNGENGGKVKKRFLSKKEREELKGKTGKNGKDAVYQRYCKDIHLPIFLGPLGEFLSQQIVISRKCWWQCSINQTIAEDGGKGKSGLIGFNGKTGGNTGSFHLKTLDTSDFTLELKKSVGLGSEGGLGSTGGRGGKAGKNGKDYKNLCGLKLPQAQKGRRGRRGKTGKVGKNGIEKLACIEILDSPKRNNQEVLDFLNQTINKKVSVNLDEIKNNKGVLCH